MSGIVTPLVDDKESFLKELPNIDNLDGEFDVSEDSTIQIKDIAEAFASLNHENVFIESCDNTKVFAEEYMENNKPSNAFTIMNFGHILRRVELFLSNLASCHAKAFFNLDYSNEILLLKLLDMVGIELCLNDVQHFDGLVESEIDLTRTIGNTLGRTKPYIKRTSGVIKTFTISDMEDYQNIHEISPESYILLNVSLSGGIESSGVDKSEIPAYLEYGTTVNQLVCGYYLCLNDMSDLMDLPELVTLAIDSGHPIQYIYIGNDFVCNNLKNITMKKMFKQLYDKYHITVYGDCSDFILFKCCFLYARVTGKRIRNGQNYLYLNDGLYGTLHEQLYSNDEITIEPMKDTTNPKKITTVFGPTCDSIDTIANDIKLSDMNINDWVTITGPKFCPNTLTDFNSFDSSKIIYLFC